jgi:hypothetical protein
VGRQACDAMNFRDSHGPVELGVRKPASETPDARGDRNGMSVFRTAVIFAFVVIVSVVIGGLIDAIVRVIHAP